MLPMNYLSSCYIDSIIISLFFNRDSAIEKKFLDENITEGQVKSCYRFKRVSALDQPPLTNYLGKTEIQHNSGVSANIIRLKKVLKNIILSLHGKQVNTPEITQSFLNEIISEPNFDTHEKIGVLQNDKTVNQLEFKLIKRKFQPLPRNFYLNEISLLIHYFRILLIGSCTSNIFSFVTEDVIEFLENFFDIFGIVGSLTEVKEQYEDIVQKTVKITPAAYIQKTELHLFLEDVDHSNSRVTMNVFLKTPEASLLLQSTNENTSRVFDIVDYSKLPFFFIGLDRQHRKYDDEGNHSDVYNDILIDDAETLTIDGKQFFLNSIICGRPGHFVCYILRGNTWYFFNDIIEEENDAVTFKEIGSYLDLQKIENTNYHPFKQGILFMYREVLLDMEPSKKISREINLFYFLGILILILILVLVIVLVMVSMNNMKKKI